MKIKYIFSLAALTLMLAACSSDEFTQEPTVTNQGIPFKAVISTGAAGTRGLTEGDKTISAAWAKDEKVALVYGSSYDIMTIESVEDNGLATITGTVSDSPNDGDNVVVVYCGTGTSLSTLEQKIKGAEDDDAVVAAVTGSDLFKSQLGTFAGINSALDLRISSEAKFAVTGSSATLSGTTKLTERFAIWKLGLTDGTNAIKADKFTVGYGSSSITVTPSEAASTIYLAVEPSDNTDFAFTATAGEFEYTCSAEDVTLEASTYYRSPIKMTISKKAGEISFAMTSISKTFGDPSFFNELTMTGDGTVTYSSSDATVAEVNATTGEVTIKGDGEAIIKATVTDGPTYTYATNEASYTLGVGTATMTVTAEGYSGTYDGNTHGISVKAPDGATVKYGTTADDYDLEANPAYTDAGTYTVYYKVTMPGFTTVTNSATVTIEKASGTISFATATPKEALHAAAADNTFTQEVTKTGDGTVTYTISDNTCGASIDASTGKVTFTQAGSVTITATVADGKNYTYATKTATYTLSVSDTTDGSGGVPDNDDYTGGGNPF